MSDDISHMFKNVFIGAMILINLSLVMFITFNSFSINAFLIDEKLFGLGDSFWGALFGAIITGFMAIKVSNREEKRRVDEREGESRKVLLNLKEYADDLKSEVIRINRVYDKAKKVYDPYAEVDVEYDKHGREHVINFPPPHEEEIYYRSIKPYKEELLTMSRNIKSLLDIIQEIDIEKLDFESYKNVLAFKQANRKLIEPWITYTNEIGGSINNQEEFKDIEKAISSFCESVT
ncbi:hypothetical protein FITA111629_11370 [Filibacter tadaridae]|uniref:Uncharacterized protein n=1 Tax=Filibacter tadaridae TaxID=2483811 RepID=A0A3P5X9X4_9BACL|nr:hypothetical protein [Filibacter tadaridae]VDC25169.1 hypothetical protein FILTAD_01199 [Filibacter tadaridae]